FRSHSGMVLSYMGRVLSGAAPYNLPPMPFVPGTNAIGRVIAAGEHVTRSEEHMSELQSLTNLVCRLLLENLGVTAMATHKAWRLHAHNDLRFDDVPTPKPASDGVLVRIEAGMVLSYMGRVLSGAAPYNLPPMPFVPGTNAIGRVIAAGEHVT